MSGLVAIVTPEQITINRGWFGVGSKFLSSVEDYFLYEGNTAAIGYLYYLPVLCLSSLHSR
jgi:hypothetical protein